MENKLRSLGDGITDELHIETRTMERDLALLQVLSPPSLHFLRNFLFTLRIYQTLTFLKI